MKKRNKNLLTAALALTLGLSLTACGSPAQEDGGSQEAEKPAIIGINQYGQHASLDNCREGFLQGLKRAWKRVPTTPSTTRTPALTTTWPFRSARPSPPRTPP